MVAPAATRITSPYGYSDDYEGFHNGIDFAWNVWGDTPVVAFRAGRVTFVGTASGWAGRGTVVTIDHGGGVVSWSCHLAAAHVAAGDDVAEGQRVGTMGATGAALGVHLHWMVYLNGVVVDPTPYLTASAGGDIEPFETEDDNMKIIGHPTDGGQKFVDEFGADDIGRFFYVPDGVTGSPSWVDNIRAAWLLAGEPDAAKDDWQYELARHIADARWAAKRGQIVTDVVTALKPILALLAPVDTTRLEELIETGLRDVVVVPAPMSDATVAAIAKATQDLADERQRDRLGA